jgi:hypothetical protein
MTKWWRGLKLKRHEGGARHRSRRDTGGRKAVEEFIASEKKSLRIQTIHLLEVTLEKDHKQEIL